MQALSSTQFAILVLVIGGRAIYLQQSERAGFEDKAREHAQAMCAAEADPDGCMQQAGSAHEACFAANFDPGTDRRHVNHRPPRLERRPYLDCVRDGYETWRSTRAGVRQAKAKQHREALQ